MPVIVLLIAASLCVAAIFLTLFIWAVKSGQYNDNYTPSIRILFDEHKRTKAESKTGNTGKP